MYGSCGEGCRPGMIVERGDGDRRVGRRPLALYYFIHFDRRFGVVALGVPEVGLEKPF